MPLEQVVEVWRQTWGADLRAVHDWFAAQPGVDQSRLAAAGGSCGVFMSLLYAETYAPHVKGAVILAGPSEARLREFVARTEAFAVLGGVSKEEAGPLAMIQEVVQASKNPQSKMFALDRAGHGADMLERDKDLSGAVVNWIAERLAVPSSPVAVNKPSLTYMPEKELAVLFGGFPRRGRAVGETWALHHNCWRKLEIAGPPARGAHGAAYDAKRKRLVIFGSAGWDGKALGDTWEFDGEKWERKNHAGRGVALVFAGFADGKFLGDTWTWDGAKWTEQKEPGAPTARGGVPAMTYDSDRKKIVMYGGWDDVGPLRDLWEWDGAWTRRHAHAVTCGVGSVTGGGQP